MSSNGRLLLTTLCLALGQSVAGGRDTNLNSDSLSVSTRAFFAKSGSNRSQQEANASAESEFIERLGHEIAKDLAHEISQEGDRAHGDKLAEPRKQPISKHQAQLTVQDTEPLALLEKGARVSQVPGQEGASQAKTDEAMRRGTSRRAAETIQESPAHILQAPGAASVLQKALSTDITKANQHPALEGLNALAGDLLDMKKSEAQPHRIRSSILDDFVHMGDKVPDFDSLDKNHEGSLSLEQFKAAVDSSVSGVDDVFKKIDKNGSGKIDKEEFDQAIKDGTITPDFFSGAVRPHTSMMFVIGLALFGKFV